MMILASSISCAVFSSLVSRMKAFSPTRGNTLSSAAAISLSTSRSAARELGANSTRKRNILRYRRVSAS